MRAELDAVVVGSGPNGLAAAVTMAAAGLRVHVIEGAPTIGGGCRTEELTLPGFWHDVCSAAHPLAVASPFFQRFDLAARGVALARPEVEFAHPLDGGRAAIVTRSVAETAAASVQTARAYQRLFGPMADHMDEICEAILRAAAQARPRIRWCSRATAAAPCCPPPRWPGAGTPRRPARSWPAPRRTP